MGISAMLRDLGPQVLAVLVRRHGQFADAEDAVQEALIAALAQWPAAGLPDNPRGWLYQVAVRRLQDQARGEIARRRREESVAAERVAREPFVPPPDSDVRPDEDDSLQLLFMCCHPALTPASAVSLTLRAVGGLTTGEIASAFLVPESTMAQRITRAKASIKASMRTSGIGFAMPTSVEHAERLAAVLHVLYLIFNEGYASSSGDALQRTDLSNEAIRLARGLSALLPNESETGGLLALMLLTDARRAARTGALGELIPLDEQDRTRWNRAQITEGTLTVERAMSRGAVGPYQLQAAIAALHGEAASVADTDWPQIHALYTVLERMTDNPMVSLNRAVAAAMTQGPEAGLVLVHQVAQDPRLAGHHRVDAVRAHLHERAGNLEDAAACYRRAAERTTSVPERDYLLLRAATVTSRVAEARSAR